MKESVQAFKILTILTAVVFTACTSDNYDDYYGNQCDLENVTYKQTVAPIISNQCLSCHNSNNASGGISLEGYENVKKQVDNGKLLGTIKHLPGYKPMPEGGKLDDCTILKIETWINNGALDN